MFEIEQFSHNLKLNLFEIILNFISLVLFRTAAINLALAASYLKDFNYSQIFNNSHFLKLNL